jgi:hypothetical protein
MNRRTLVSVAALALTTAIFVPGSVRAQGSSGSQTGDATAPSPQAQANSAGTPIAATSASTTTTTTAPAPAKKVWTDEDMRSVHKNDAISTFSNAGGKPANNKPAANTKGNKDAKQYQTQIIRLQEKLPPLDEQISQLQAALNGDTVNSTRHVGGAKIDDWHDELVRLQKQREDITTRISALQDEARRNGVPENQIPE